MNDENNNYIDVESSPVNDNGSDAFGNKFIYEDGKKFNKKKRKGILGKVAGCLLLTVTGGLFGGGITYSLIKNSANNGNGIENVPNFRDYSENVLAMKYSEFVIGK